MALTCVQHSSMSGVRQSVIHNSTGFSSLETPNTQQTIRNTAYKMYKLRSLK